eukprot:11303235-Heterocapsa_arctica.AAC.1
MKKVQACKQEDKSIQQKLRNSKQSGVKKEQKRRHIGAETHATNADLETGNESVERGARQATLDSW